MHILTSNLKSLLAPKCFPSRLNHPNPQSTCLHLSSPSSLLIFHPCPLLAASICLQANISLEKERVSNDISGVTAQIKALLFPFCSAQLLFVSLTCWCQLCPPLRMDRGEFVYFLQKNTSLPLGFRTAIYQRGISVQT